MFPIIKQEVRNKIPENFNIKHLRWSKTDLFQETETTTTTTTTTKILRRDTLRISVAAVRRCTVKKVSLKISPPIYLHTIKMTLSSGQKPALTCQNPDISDQIYKASY